MSRISLITAPVAVATLLTLATAAGGVWMHKKWLRQQAAATDTGPFRMEVAIDLAGRAVPEGIESFYFFPIARDATDIGPELQEMLARAAAEQDYVGITGVDPEYNLATVTAALAAPREGDLAGLVIVYVGPAEHEAPLRESVASTGAELRYVHYSPAPSTGAI